MANLIAQADRDYEPGHIIIECPSPLIQVTKYEHRLFTCDHCMCKVNSTILCPRCQKVYYCSRECQDKHQIHQLECPILSRHKPLQFENNGIDYMQRLTLRLYLLMTTFPEIRSQEFRLHNGMTRCLDDMEAHSNEIKDSPQFKGILNYFKLYKIDTYDYDLLLRCYGILQINSFGIDTYSNTTNDVQIEHCGTGLYIEASVFDHSCLPNACAGGNGNYLEIRALSPIRKGDLISIDYLQDILPRAERRSALEERYFFTCQCTHCDCAEELINFKRFSVLSRVIDSASEQNEMACNWSQLYGLWKQRLNLQEKYYAASIYHPSLSLYYRDFLRFILVNQHRLNASINQQQQNHPQESTTAANNAVVTTVASSVLTVHEIEQDLIEFGMKTKQHIAITHGVNHSFYTKLFAVDDKQENALSSSSSNQ